MSAIEKQRHILDFTLSSLGRRKGKNIALVIVYTFVLFLLASVLFLTDALKKEAALILQDAPEMMVQRLVAGRQDPIPKHYIDSIKGIRGVQSVAPRLWGYYYDALSGANYTLMVNAELNDHAGRIIIGAGVARRSETGQDVQTLQKNDVIPFKTYDGSVLPLKVAGLLPSASELVTSDLILVSEADFKKIFSIANDHATDLVLKVRNAKELATIAAKITQTPPGQPPDTAGGDTADIQRGFRLARRGDPHGPYRCFLRLHHPGMGQGNGIERGGKTGNRYPQGNRLGNLGYIADEILGRRGCLPYRLFYRHIPGLSPYFSGIRQSVRTCVERMVGPLPRFQTHAVHRCLSDRDPVFSDGHSLYRGNHRAVVAVCND